MFLATGQSIQFFKVHNHDGSYEMVEEHPLSITEGAYRVAKLLVTNLESLDFHHLPQPPLYDCRVGLCIGKGLSSFVYSGEQRKEGTKVGKCVVKLAKPGHQAELVHEQAILKQLNSSESLECRCALVEVRAHRVGAGTQ